MICVKNSKHLLHVIIYFSFTYQHLVVEGTRQLEYSITTNEMSNSIDHQSHLSARTDPQPQASFRDNNSNHQTALPILEKRITPRASPAMSLLASNMNKLRDPLAPQPYDPIGGFVIFFDFVVSLPSTIDQCSLVTCLYHPKSGLGEPSQLEPFKCEQYMDERHGERMSVALIATKQPVPRLVNSKKDEFFANHLLFADVHHNKR
jgi:hypothetical protein